MDPRYFFALFMLAFFVTVLIAIAVSMTFRYKRRELEHRERMAALERGAALPILEEFPSRNSWRPTTLLLRGMMWLFSGVGLSVFLLGLSLSSGREIPASVRVQNAMHARSEGASEQAVEMILNDKMPNGLPRSFFLIGLLPMGVGLAYLITYRKESGLKTAS